MGNNCKRIEKKSDLPSVAITSLVRAMITSELLRKLNTILSINLNRPLIYIYILIDKVPDIILETRSVVKD